MAQQQTIWQDAEGATYHEGCLTVDERKDMKIVTAKWADEECDECGNALRDADTDVVDEDDDDEEIEDDDDEEEDE